MLLLFFPYLFISFFGANENQIAQYRYDSTTNQRQNKSRRNAGRAMLKMKIRNRQNGNQYVSDKVPSLAFLFRNTFKNCDFCP